MIKNILITGAGGQDGKIILQKLAKKKINLFLISRKFNKKKNYKNIYFVKLDLLHKKKLNIFFKKHKINTILHLAANNPSYGQNSFKKHYLQNISASRNLIDLSLKYNKKIKFIFCSSSRIFKKKNGIVKENSQIYKRDFYSKFKNEINEYLKKIKLKNKNLNYKNAILFNHD